MTPDPNVSVVIPTFNGARFIREALESVFRQTLLPWEIIVVDDASDDETPGIVSSMIPGAPVPLRPIRLKTNSGGPARPLNVGIGSASGDYIAVLEQDDLFLPETLEKRAGLLCSYPRLAFIFSYCGSYHKPGRIMQLSSQVRELETIGRKRKGGYYEIEGKEIMFLMMRDTNFICGYPGFVFRKRDWEQKGGLDEGLRIASDYEFLCSLASQGPAGFIPEIGYLRREHGRNLSNQLFLIFLEAARVRVQYLLREKWLLGNEALVRFLKQQFLDFANQYIAAKHYSLAFELLNLYGRVWGWGEQVLLETKKCLSHRMLSDGARSFPIHKDNEEKIKNGQNGEVVVSIIMIFLNDEKYLREAIESVFSQTFTDWELLLVDDGSMDGSTQTAQEFAQAHPQKVRYFQHEGHTSKGTGPSRNLGLVRSRGRLIAFLDADDIWFPEKLEKQVSLLEQYPQAGLAACPALYWYDDGRKVSQPITLLPGLMPRWAWLPKILESDDEAACPSMVLMRRDLAVQAGGPEESLGTGFDGQAMCCKISLNAPVYYHPECLGLYRIHPASVSQPAPLEQKVLARHRFNSWLTLLIRKHFDPSIIRGPALLALMAQAKSYDVIVGSKNGHFEAGKNGAAAERFLRLRRNMKRVCAYGSSLGYVFSGILLLEAVSPRLASKFAKRIFLLAKTGCYESLSKMLEEAVKILPRYILRKVRLFLPQPFRTAGIRS